jgi:hypothetical protein
MAAILKEFGGVEMDLSTIEERTDKAHPPNFMIERPVIAEAGVRNQHGKAWIDGVGFMKETASRSGTVATRLRTGCGMPVDLADYSPNLKAGLKKAGFACVYVASFESGRPCRVGYALDLGEAIKRFQRTSPLPIVVHGAMWVPDRGMATRIAQSVLASIAPHRKAGGRHDLPAEAASGEVGLTTSRLYPGAVTVPHDQLIGRWAKERA